MQGDVTPMKETRQRGIRGNVAFAANGHERDRTARLDDWTMNRGAMTLGAVTLSMTLHNVRSETFVPDPAGAACDDWGLTSVVRVWTIMSGLSFPFTLTRSPMNQHSTISRTIRGACLFLVLSSVAHADDSIVAPDAEVVKLAGDMKFTEGPVWIPSQEILVFSDIPNSKLMQWSAKNGLSVFRDSKNANGNIIDMEGRIISCQHSGRNLIRIEGDEATVLVDRYDGKRFNSPNDVAIRHDGTLWFTDPPWGLWGSDAKAEVPGHWVYKFDPQTKKIEAIVKDLAMPNGIVFSPDEERVYVADTGGHPRHPDLKMRKLPGGIHCYDVESDGSLGKKRFTIAQGSDGMAVDVQGNIYTTHGGEVTVYNADGKKLTAIKVPENPANVCFGGKEFKTLFITARTSLYSVQLQVAGDKPGK